MTFSTFVPTSPCFRAMDASKPGQTASLFLTSRVVIIENGAARSAMRDPVALLLALCRGKEIGEEYRGHPPEYRNEWKRIMESASLKRLGRETRVGGENAGKDEQDADDEEQNFWIQNSTEIS